MDPNEALRRARKAAKRIVDDDSNTAEAQDFAETFLALDGWLSGTSGSTGRTAGFLPDDWEKARR